MAPRGREPRVVVFVRAAPGERRLDGHARQPLRQAVRRRCQRQPEDGVLNERCASEGTSYFRVYIVCVDMTRQITPFAILHSPNEPGPQVSA